MVRKGGGMKTRSISYLKLLIECIVITIGDIHSSSNLLVLSLIVSTVRSSNIVLKIGVMSTMRILNPSNLTTSIPRITPPITGTHLRLMRIIPNQHIGAMPIEKVKITIVMHNEAVCLLIMCVFSTLK